MFYRWSGHGVLLLLLCYCCIVQLCIAIHCVTFIYLLPYFIVPLWFYTFYLLPFIVPYLLHLPYCTFYYPFYFIIYFTLIYLLPLLPLLLYYLLTILLLLLPCYCYCIVGVIVLFNYCIYCCLTLFVLVFNFVLTFIIIIVLLLLLTFIVIYCYYYWFTYSTIVVVLLPYPTFVMIYTLVHCTFVLPCIIVICIIGDLYMLCVTFLPCGMLLLLLYYYSIVIVISDIPCHIPYCIVLSNLLLLYFIVDLPYPLLLFIVLPLYCITLCTIIVTALLPWPQYDPLLLNLYLVLFCCYYWHCYCIVLLYCIIGDDIPYCYYPFDVIVNNIIIVIYYYLITYWPWPLCLHYYCYYSLNIVIITTLLVVLLLLLWPRMGWFGDWWIRS